MKLVGVKRRISLFLINKILKGTNPNLFAIKRGLLNWCGIRIGTNSKIVGPLYITGTLEVGESVWIGKNLTIHGNGHVLINDNCDIAPDVMFVTGGHEIGNVIRRAGTGFNKNIEIGKGSWIGTRSTILGGVTIGDACVVGACSMVNKDITNNIVVGGIPAKTIKILE